jgi:hypothetical protein
MTETARARAPGPSHPSLWPVWDTSPDLHLLYHDDTKVGEGRIKTQPGFFSLAGEGLCVGRDSGEAVTDHCAGVAPYRFTGGTIKRIAVDVSGEPYLDLERQAVAMLARE